MLAIEIIYVELCVVIWLGKRQHQTSRFDILNDRLIEEDYLNTTFLKYKDKSGNIDYGYIIFIYLKFIYNNSPDYINNDTFFFLY